MRNESDTLIERTNLHAEMAKYLYSNSTGALITASVVAVLLTYILWESSPHALLVSWLVLIEFIYLARMFLEFAYLRAPVPKDGNLWLTRFRIGAIASGIAWTLVILLFFPAHNVITQSALSFTTIGLAAGGAMAYAIDFVSLAGYAAPLLLSLSVCLIAEGTPQSIAMGIMLVLSIGFIAITLRRSNKAMHENIHLRIESSRREEVIHEKNEYLQAILENEPECVKVVSKNGELLEMNRSGLIMLEVESVEEARRIGLLGFIQPEYRQPFIELHKSVCAGNTGKLEFQIKGKKGTLRWLETHATPLREANGEITALLGLTHDISERKQTERREQHRQIVLHMLADQSPLATILDRIVRDVEALNPTMLCSILLLDKDGIHLRHGAAPSLPDSYNQAIDGAAIGPTAGSCGAAIFTGKRVIVDDIATHPYWVPYLELAQSAGVAACWSEPIISGRGKVLGSFAIYHRYPSQPTPSDLKLIEDEALLAALVIDKTGDESRLKLTASVFSHAREGIMITDANGTILEVNDTLTDITGYSSEEVLGKNPRIFQSGRQSSGFYKTLWQTLIGTGTWTGELWNSRKNGELYVQMTTISAVRDDQGRIQHFVALFSDITQAKEHQNKLEHIAHYDALTGLPNRVLLADRLQQAMLQSQRRSLSLAVVYLDLDGFKAVNDKHGHDTGDELLIDISQRMKLALREGDSLARIGGDEFVAILIDLEQSQDCEPVLARLLQAASDPVALNGVELQVSASIGVTLYPQDEVNADQLMRHADQAMYLAKQAGKNRFHLFDVAQDVAIQSQRESLKHIHRALDQGEFVLYYQPKVNMLTGKVIGAEALIRWQHPEQGLLPPAAFLPTIEGQSISIDLGEWVIETALQQMSAWHEDGLEISVSVNVGARQLLQHDFVAQLSGLLIKYPDIPSSWLELEILETSALEDMAQVSAIMQACQKLGVQFALDDFGTGYSSLTYLKHLPAQMLKIDQSFVRDMLGDKDDLALVEGIIGLAAVFQRKVIAEGVESIEHGARLLSMGCKLAQGYGIARPMPASELPNWVASWQPDLSWSNKLLEPHD